MNDVLQLLLANLDAAYLKRGWHGPTLRGTLRGLRPDDVLWRPAPGRHNIWELTAHAAYWKYAVCRRLRGVKRAGLANWIAAPSTVDETTWRELVDLLENEHRKLRDVIASLTAAELRDPKKLRMVYGVAAHDVYHAGQIQLVKCLRSS
jgi:hypothetical protein